MPKAEKKPKVMRQAANPWAKFETAKTGAKYQKRAQRRQKARKYQAEATALMKKATQMKSAKGPKGLAAGTLKEMGKGLKGTLKDYQKKYNKLIKKLPGTKK